MFIVNWNVHFMVVVFLEVCAYVQREFRNSVVAWHFMRTDAYSGGQYHSEGQYCSLVLLAFQCERTQSDYLSTSTVKRKNLEILLSERRPRHKPPTRSGVATYWQHVAPISWMGRTCSWVSLTLKGPEWCLTFPLSRSTGWNGRTSTELPSHPAGRPAW